MRTFEEMVRTIEIDGQTFTIIGDISTQTFKVEDGVRYTGYKHGYRYEDMGVKKFIWNDIRWTRHPGEWCKYDNYAVGTVDGVFCIINGYNSRLDGLEGSMDRDFTEKRISESTWQLKTSRIVTSFGEYAYIEWPECTHSETDHNDNTIIVTDGGKPWRGPNAFRWEDVD